MNNGVSDDVERTVAGSIGCACEDGDAVSSVAVDSVHELFERMLTVWAFDWLRLLSRGLDQPICAGRVIDSGAEISAEGVTEEEQVLSGGRDILGGYRLQVDDVFGVGGFRRIGP